jgi:hypothetical protein
MIFDIPARYAREMRGMICAFYVHMLGCGARTQECAVWISNATYKSVNLTWKKITSCAIIVLYADLLKFSFFFL